MLHRACCALELALTQSLRRGLSPKSFGPKQARQVQPSWGEARDACGPCMDAWPTWLPMQGANLNMPLYRDHCTRCQVPGPLYQVPGLHLVPHLAIMACVHACARRIHG